MADREIDQWLWQVGAELQRLSESGGKPFSRGLAWEPRVDVLESHDAYLVCVELAGVRSADIRLSVDPATNALSVRGFRRSCVGEHVRPRVLEIIQGEFEREITVGEHPIDLQQITATFEDGILHVQIPKAKNLSQTVVRRTIIIESL